MKPRSTIYVRDAFMDCVNASLSANRYRAHEEVTETHHGELCDLHWTLDVMVEREASKR